jgi:hypothetical protein
MSARNLFLSNPNLSPGPSKCECSLQTQIDAIEESLSGQLSQAMREKMENKLKEIEQLAQFDSQNVRKPRDTGR